MAWFRIEMNKDGSVAASQCVGPSSGDKGSRVFYIEAESETFAIAAAVSRYRSYLDRQRTDMANGRAARKAACLCRDCGAPVSDGMLRCRICLDHEKDVRHNDKPPGVRGVVRPIVQELRLERAGRSQRFHIIEEILRAAIRMKAGIAFISWLRAERDAAEGGKSVAAE